MHSRTFALLLSFAATLAAQTNPLLPENSVTRVSDHVYAIMGWPNIAIVVGSRGVLVVDTGLGPRNGAVALREAEKLAKPAGAANLYLTTTHFHPEHSSGASAFPPRTILIRAAVQQEEMNRGNAMFIDRFSARSPQFKELLAGVTTRDPDVVFDRELTLDLGGGVKARLLWLGGGHTKGDELIFVEPDGALISGDIVQSKIVPGMPNEDASVKGWLALLDKIEPLHARYLVPDHGALGDGSLVAQQRAFLADLQARVGVLKKEGKPIEEATTRITEEFRAKYPGWETMTALGNVVKRAWAEAQ